MGAGPSTADLQLLLNAALEALGDRYGPVDADYRAVLRPFGQWVRLGRRVSAVDAVIEGRTTLDPSAYALWPDDDAGKFLRRLDTSGFPQSWTDWVEVTATPFSEEANRDRVTLALIDFGLSNPEGLAGITVGPWSEQYQTRDPGDLRMEREAIIASMRPALSGVW